MTAKNAPPSRSARRGMAYSPCTGTIFRLKQRDTARMLRRETQPLPITGPLVVMPGRSNIHKKPLKHKLTTMEQNKNGNKLIQSPFTQTYFHGTKADFKVGDLIEVGFNSNFGQRMNAKYIFLTATLDAAIWGAELAFG